MNGRAGSSSRDTVPSRLRRIRSASAVCMSGVAFALGAKIAGDGKIDGRDVSKRVKQLAPHNSPVKRSSLVKAKIPDRPHAEVQEISN